MHIKKLTIENIIEMRELYRHFENVAQKDFLFEVPPLCFQDFQSNFENNFIQGFFNDNGFILYTDALNETIELTLLFTKDKNDKETCIDLLSFFITEIKNMYSDKTISYPMLGVQNEIASDAIRLGFKPVGETVLEFNFQNVISQVILEKSIIPILNYPYNFDYWQNSYFDNAVHTIFNEFKNSNDTKFDPRFKSLNGVKNILDSIVNGYYGDFDPKYVSVLKYDYIPVGYCFVNFTNDTNANIPLLVIDKEHQNKHFSSILLANSIKSVKLDSDNENNKIKLINVTCDTENHSAIRAYRSVGFKEKTYYTHAYMEI